MDGTPAIPHQRNHPESGDTAVGTGVVATAAGTGAKAESEATAKTGAEAPAEAAAETAAEAGAEAAAKAESEAPAQPGAEAPAQPGTAPAAEASATTGNRFAVLGPIRAWRGSEALPSGTPQQRALLAVLLLRDGRTATAPELIDAIWGEDPPQQALATIRTYASRLRKVLDPGLLVSESGGYAIRLPRHEALDLGIARALAADAEAARSEKGDRALARTLLASALNLWDGEPLAGVPGPHADTERTRLAEWRLQLLETRLDLDLELGHHAEAVSELTALTAAHPCGSGCASC